MLKPGARLGVYEIVLPIGAGGMGEVYRARDGRLNRDHVTFIFNFLDELRRIAPAAKK